MDDLLQDLRLGFRSLWKHRATSLFIIVSIGLAIAGNASTFSVIGAMLFRPFPYPQADRLLLLWDTPEQKADDQNLFSPATYLELKARTRTLAGLEGFSSRSFNLVGGDQPEEVNASVTTPGGLELLGFQPQLGRGFQADESLPGKDHVVLVSQELWKRRFGGDPGLIGRSINLDDEPYTVIGVMPPDIEFLSLTTSLWVPFTLDPANPPRDQRSLVLVGRVAPGVAIEAAKSELMALSRELAAAHPETQRGFVTRAYTLREQVPGPTDRFIFGLMQSVMVLVLLIACANVANLLLARGQDRQREIALRTTLGAGRGAVIRQLLTESLLLAAAGGALGLALSSWTIDFMAKMLASQVPKAFMPRLDMPVLVAGAVVSIAAGVLFGLYPALAAARPDLARALHDGAKGAVSRRRRRIVNGLVAAEIAFALGALSATGMLVRTMVLLQHLDGGFESKNLLTFRLALPEKRYPGPEAGPRFFAQAAEKLLALPGVEAVTAASSLPRLRAQPVQAFHLEARPDEATLPSEIVVSVFPNYFSTLRIGLRSGRGFESTDRDGMPEVAIVSQAWARKYFPGQEALGQRLEIDGVQREIVGISADVVQGRIVDKEGPNPVIYLPAAQTASRALYLIARTPEKPTALAAAFRGAVWDLDRALPIPEIATFDQRIAKEFVGARLIAGILACFGFVALLLAGLGIYGVIAYSVAQQTHEIGVRLAIGAQKGTVMGQVARKGLQLSALGLALGLPLVGLAVLGLRAGISGLPAEVYTSVPLVAAVLATVAGLASFVPAQRAANLDPAIALRQD